MRICLSMQGAWVRSLVREDHTCRRTTKPGHHNTEPVCCNYWSPCAYNPREATAMRTQHTATNSSPCSLQLAKAHAQQQRLSGTKNNNNKKVTHTSSLYLFPHHKVWDCFCFWSPLCPKGRAVPGPESDLNKCMSNEWVKESSIICTTGLIFPQMLSRPHLYSLMSLHLIYFLANSASWKSNPPLESSPK